MEKQKLLPDKARVLSGSALKVIAVLTMLIDHVGSHLIDRSIVLCSLAGHKIYLFQLMRMVGRMAFPLFCFLLVEGFIYTHSRLKYGINLFAFALISEIPWNLEHCGRLLNYRTQNVFFTLLFGFLAMCAVEYLKKVPVAMIAAILVAAFASKLLKFDFGLVGVVFIVLLYALREHEVLRIPAIFVLHRPWTSMLAFIPISLYNGKRGFIKGKILKYAFYAFYPAHIFVIYLIKYHVI